MLGSSREAEVGRGLGGSLKEVGILDHLFLLQIKGVWSLEPPGAALLL